MSSNPFLEFVQRYHDHPDLFAEEVVGMPFDPWQKEEALAIASGTRKIAVRSGHGVGKSTFAAIVMVWFLSTRFPVKVVVTAPTSAQLFDALFAEVKAVLNKLPDMVKGLFTVKSDRVEVSAAPDEAFISARTSRAETPEALQGVHSEHVLLVVDEASGVPPAVFEAAGGSMSGHNACTLLLGNPTRADGFFYDCFHRMAHEWRTRRVSCEDSPRVSKAYVDEMRARYGEESNAFRVRVLGEFPRSSDDMLIPLDLVESAMHRDVVARPDLAPIWGLDVARFGDDRSALAERTGNVVTAVESWRNLDLMATCGRVKAKWDALLPKYRPSEIIVDSIGVGAGVVDRLRELGLPARGVNVSESPAFVSTSIACVNLRAELWVRMKEWLERRDCKLPKDDTLLAELTSCRYLFSSSGKLQIESKADAKKRGIPSPDLADAVILTLASDATVVVNGGVYGSKSWNEPLKRGLKGVA